MYMNSCLPACLPVYYRHALMTQKQLYRSRFPRCIEPRDIGIATPPNGNFYAGGPVFIIMEYASGGNLKEHLDQCRQSLKQSGQDLSVSTTAPCKSSSFLASALKVWSIFCRLWSIWNWPEWECRRGVGWCHYRVCSQELRLSDSLWTRASWEHGGKRLLSLKFLFPLHMIGMCC